MARAQRTIGARATVSLCAACLCGCVSAPQPAERAGSNEAAAPASAGPVYDWRPLMVVPFGTLLKDVPLALDEVLMFHDAAERGPAGAPNEIENGDCFSMDGASPPQFLARRPNSYLLCFEHDRLRRIETSVQLAEAQAEPLLGALCSRWLARAEDITRAPDHCAGREGDIEWRVRVARESESSATLSMTLIDARPVPRE